MSTTYLSPISVPSGTEFPGTVQGVIDLIAQYLRIVGSEDSAGLNFGSTTPSADDRDKPWFKTTPSGSPLGLFSWDGAAWSKTPTTISSGTTAERPASPSTSTQYHDTTINCMLLFERGKWRTLSGSPGDIKFAKAQTLAEAITSNPGWVEYVDARGRVLGGAGAGSGLTEREQSEKAGAEDVTLTLSQIPTFVPKVNYTLSSNYTQSGTNIEGAPGTQGGVKQLSGDPIGGGEPHSVMQPTLFAWCLIKE